MRLAALHDIHENLPALNAALTQIDALDPDLIVVGIGGVILYVVEINREDESMARDRFWRSSSLWL